jgi:transcriptional regulator with XRE-family HTH domain
VWFDFRLFYLEQKGLKMSGVTLKVIRFFNNMSQSKLCRKTGIHQSKLSLAENGLIKLSEGEKMKIASVLGGQIDWKATKYSISFRYMDYGTD